MATNLGPRGLHTFANELQYPEGAQTRAENMVIDKEGVTEPRRGFKQYGESFGSTGLERAKQLFTYKGRVFVHHENVLEFDNGSGTFTPFSTNVLEPEAGIRIKHQEANGNLYFTSKDGIEKISVNSASQLNINSIILAGGVKAIGLDGVIDYSGIPWFLPNSKVAYKVVWGYKDNNNNLILGTPSPSLEIFNRSLNELAGTKLTIDIPSDVVQNVHFYQIYRSDNIEAAPPALLVDDIGIPDEYKLIYEEFPTADEFTAKTIVYEDITGNDIQKTGTPLYTNENTGVGILQANDRPPLATDLTLFNGSLFFSNTYLPHFLSSTLLGVLNFTPNVSDFIISNGDHTDVYTFVGQNEVAKLTPVSPWGVSGAYTPSDFYGQGFVVHSPNNVTTYAVYFGDSTPSLPTFKTEDGWVLIQVDISATTTFSQMADEVVDKLMDDPSFSQDFLTEKTDTQSIEMIGMDNGFAKNAYSLMGAKRIEKITNALVPVVTLTGHGYSNGDKLYITDSGETLLDNKVVDVSNVTVDTFEINIDLSSLAAPITFALAKPALSVSNIAAVDTTKARITTSTSHGLSTENYVYIFGTGITELDGQSVIVNNVHDTTNFDVDIDIGVQTSTQGSVTQPDMMTIVQEGIGEDAAQKKVKIGGSPSVAQSVRITAKSLTSVVNKQSDSPVRGYYSSNVDELPGRMLFENKDNSDKPFYLATSDPNLIKAFNPEMPLSRAATVAVGEPAVITLVAHGLTTGQEIIVHGSTTTPSIDGKYIITKLDDDTFSIPTEAETIGNLNFFLTTVVSENEAIPNRLYFSKYQQPDAVPRTNYLDIGERDKPIDRIVALRDSLLVFKEDGIFRVYGNIAPAFQVSLFDTSTKLIAPDSAAVLNNRVYCLTTQGVSSVTDNAVNVISRPVEDKFHHLSGIPSVKYHSFGISSETDRAYMLWTIQDGDDTHPMICYRYNVFTNAWTEWPIAKNCGTINPLNDKIYLGPVDINQVEIERKNRNRFDYADREYSLSIPVYAVEGKTIELSNATGVVRGDIIEQVQYITLTSFNRLLRKLDDDPGIPSTDYVETLKMVPGDNLLSKMAALATKLNADDNATYIVPTSPDFADLQDDYNAFVDVLNSANSLAFYKTFSKSTEEHRVEALVVGKQPGKNKIETRFERPFLEGPITHYKAIKTNTTWIPQHFGDPYTFKQIAEGTFLFKFNNFTSGYIGYNSDIEQDFSRDEVFAYGPGAYGSFDYGGHTFGGQGNKVPIRTYIPRSKQKCRFLQCRFEHENAFESYQLYGVTFNPRPFSVRAYK